MIELATMVDGYFSDLTYMGMVGAPSQRQKEIYNHLLKAQQAATQELRPGNSFEAPDQDRPPGIGEGGPGQVLRPYHRAWCRPAVSRVHSIPGSRLGGHAGRRHGFERRAGRLYSGLWRDADRGQRGGRSEGPGCPFHRRASRGRSDDFEMQMMATELIAFAPDKRLRGVRLCQTWFRHLSSSGG